jgi:hypothetical protein
MLQAGSFWPLTLDVRIQFQACHFGIYCVFVITLLHVFPISHMRASWHAFLNVLGSVTPDFLLRQQIMEYQLHRLLHSHLSYVSLILLKNL